MAGTRDRKLFVAALGVALAGLALDRVVLSDGGLSPRTAAATPVEAPAGVWPAAAGAGPELQPGTIAQLGDRLKRLEQERGLDPARVRNAFWLEGLSKSDGPAKGGDAEQIIAAFKEGHKLRAVVWDSGGGGGGFVVVGEKRLEIGDVLEGFTLVGVEVDQAGRRAVFDFDGRRVQLAMDVRNLTRTGGGAQDRGGAGR